MAGRVEEVMVSSRGGTAEANVLIVCVWFTWLLVSGEGRVKRGKVLCRGGLLSQREVIMSWRDVVLRCRD